MIFSCTLCQIPTLNDTRIAGRPLRTRYLTLSGGDAGDLMPLARLWSRSRLRGSLASRTSKQKPRRERRAKVGQLRSADGDVRAELVGQSMTSVFSFAASPSRVLLDSYTCCCGVYKLQPTYMSIPKTYLGPGKCATQQLK